MITMDEASVRLSEAVSAGRISSVGGGEYPAMALGTPVPEVPGATVEGHRARALGGSRRRVLRRARVRHGRPSRQDVSGRHQCPQRADDGRERPGPGRLRDRQEGAGCSPDAASIARDTRHHSAEFAELCARVLAAAGFRVFLFRDYRSTPLLSFAVRHLHCDAGIMITASHNPPSDNGFKCYSLDRRPGDPARRSRHHRMRQGRLRSRDPREAARGRAGRRLDRLGRTRARRRLHRLGRERVGQPRPRPLDRLHAAARRRRDLGGRRRCGPRASSESTSSNPSARPTATSPPCPATSPTPSIPGRSRPRSPRPENSRRGSRAGERPGRRPDRRRRSPSPAIRAASGRRSTATRSASCSPRS